jgi:hypothetical protein
LLADEALKFAMAEELRCVINNTIKQFQRLLIRTELFKIPGHKDLKKWPVASGWC